MEFSLNDLTIEVMDRVNYMRNEIIKLEKQNYMLKKEIESLHKSKKEEKDK